MKAKRTLYNLVVEEIEVGSARTRQGDKFNVHHEAVDLREVMVEETTRYMNLSNADNIQIKAALLGRRAHCQYAVLPIIPGDMLHKVLTAKEVRNSDVYPLAIINK